MTRIVTKHRTFSKSTKKLIIEEMPEARDMVKRYLLGSLTIQIKDKNNNTLGYWAKVEGFGTITTW